MRVFASESDNRGWGEHLGWGRRPSYIKRQPGRRQETDGGPGRRRRGGRAGKQEVTARIHRSSPGARQKTKCGNRATAGLPAPTRPAADAALAIRTAAAVTAGTRCQRAPQQPERRSANARQHARRRPRRPPWPDRAAQGRSARPLGPLVTVLVNREKKIKKPMERL